MFRKLKAFACERELQLIACAVPMFMICAAVAIGVSHREAETQGNSAAFDGGSDPTSTLHMSAQTSIAIQSDMHGGDPIGGTASASRPAAIAVSGIR